MGLPGGPLRLPLTPAERAEPGNPQKTPQRAGTDLNEIFLRAPATIANFGPGFDIFALALAAPYDHLQNPADMSRGEVTVRIIDGRDNLPTEAEKNTAGLAAIHFFKKSRRRAGPRSRSSKKCRSARGWDRRRLRPWPPLTDSNKLFEDRPRRCRDHRDREPGRGGLGRHAARGQRRRLLPGRIRLRPESPSAAARTDRRPGYPDRRPGPEENR